MMKRKRRCLDILNWMHTNFIMLKLNGQNQFVEQNSTFNGSIHHIIQIKFCVKLFQLFSDIHLLFVGHLQFLGRVPTSYDKMYINIGSKTCLLAFSNKVIDKQQLRFDKLWFGSEPGPGPSSLAWAGCYPGRWKMRRGPE